MTIMCDLGQKNVTHELQHFLPTFQRSSEVTDPGRSLLLPRGVATNFRLGRTNPDWGGGGTDSGESKLPIPKFRFHLGFRPLYFGNIRKCKSFSKYSENLLNKQRFLLGIPPEFRTGGRTRPPHPPSVATPMLLPNVTKFAFYEVSWDPETGYRVHYHIDLFMPFRMSVMTIDTRVGTCNTCRRLYRTRAQTHIDGPRQTKYPPLHTTLSLVRLCEYTKVLVAKVLCS